jgi:polygalacturonase
LENGAVLKGSPALSDYRKIGYRHNELGDVESMLYAMNAKGVRIAGEGTIDLNGESFYHMDKPNIPEYMRGRITPEQEKECTVLYDRRINQPMFFGMCDDLRVTGVRIQNAPCWTMSFVECENVRVLDLTIENSLVIPNNDGMHFCSSRDVVISRCKIKSADDCISITAITDWEKPSENYVISDCILTSCSKTIVMGYMHSIVRNITISNIVMNGCNRGICFMASPGTGLVENVSVANVYIDTYVRAGNWWGNGEAVLFIGTYHHGYGAPVPQRNWADSIRNITFSNINCETENVIGLVGSGKNISGVYFNDIKIRMKPSKNIALKGRIADLSPAAQVETLPRDGNMYWLLLQDVRDVHFTRVTVMDMAGVYPGMVIKDCDNITGV